MIPKCEWCGEFRAAPDSTRCRLCEPQALDGAVNKARAEREHRRAMKQAQRNAAYDSTIEPKPGATMNRWRRGKSTGSYGGNRRS